MNEPRRAGVIGTGLIGGSIGRALRVRGWHVTGSDLDPSCARRALELGALDAVGTDPDAEITFVAVPVLAVPDAVNGALRTSSGVVTDVGSVKAPIASAVDDPRFVPGHPMAGSEQDGVEGADPELFEGAVWVLTPTDTTEDSAYAAVHAVVSDLGADVVVLAPERHDRMVAVVSHVPHLTAATLMGVADERADEHRALLRLAAGGFRDMTRVSAGHPGIWPDICAENKTAICEVLDELIEGLASVRQVVAGGNRGALLDRLDRARRARTNLPIRALQAQELSEVRIPVPDRPGVVAEVATLATDLGVNLHSVEIAHSSEGERGVLIVVVDHDVSVGFHDALVARGYTAAVTRLE